VESKNSLLVAPEFDSPEVDGEVLISKEIQLKKGQFYSIEITGSEEFDLYGKVTNPLSGLKLLSI
jgi:ribosomal protein S12 methylthiotransferase